MHSHIQIFKHDPESRIPENIFLPKSKFQGAQIINTSSITSDGNVDCLPPASPKHFSVHLNLAPVFMINVGTSTLQKYPNTKGCKNNYFGKLCITACFSQQPLNNFKSLKTLARFP